MSIVQSEYAKLGSSLLIYFSKGLVVVPVLPDFTALEIENVLLDFGSKTFLSVKTLLSKVAGKTFEDLVVTITTDNFSIVSANTKTC